MNFTKIEKEEIGTIHFPKTDVLASNEKRNERNRKLITASLLGNTEKEKCKIFFRSDRGDTYVETTIWAVTDKFVCLKGGVVLLTAAIFDVITL